MTQKLKRLSILKHLVKTLAKPRLLLLVINVNRDQSTPNILLDTDTMKPPLQKHQEVNAFRLFPIVLHHKRLRHFRQLPIVRQVSKIYPVHLQDILAMLLPFE